MICRFVALNVACACLLLNMVAAGNCEDNPTVALPVVQKLQQWLHGPVQVRVRNEASGAVSALESKLTPISTELSPTQHTLDTLGLSVTEQFLPTERGMAWDLRFSGQGPRAGHEVTIELPLLTEQQQIFTPSERGIMALAAYPTFAPAAYAKNAYGDGRCYMLPLVSVFDPHADTAVTIALPADSNTPHLQIDWQNAKTLRLRLGHRGMGAGKPSSIRLLFYTHPADYRAAIRMYSDDFPRYFRPALPRGPYEGAFWYHHIHNHPDFEEMARQNVRYIWTSFWFTHLGEYLPDSPQWAPYTYSKWWSLKERMSDDRINAFIREMHDQKIGVFAYFNVTEYGGSGGQSGDTETAARILRERFANALIKDADGQPIPTWEGALGMNARRDCSLFPALAEQVRRHIARLPQLDGFAIDRLDWASIIDYGHDDGLTMIGKRPAQNMAGPVAEAVEEVCRQAHAVGWRVYVNKYFRVEVLRDVDGYCDESDHVRGLHYVSAFRPGSAWNHQKPYDGDLLQFEAQLKRRLQFAVFPQMIAHQFPISQQSPNSNAADLLELYAPLFSTLDGKEQVLLPHCVSASGANDVNLFVNRAGNFVAPVTSRVRFLSRRTAAVEPVLLRLRVPNATNLAWAYVVSADGPPYWATVQHASDIVEVKFDRHGTSSMIIVGRGVRPLLPSIDANRLQSVRDRLFPAPDSTAADTGTRPALNGIQSATLFVNGVNLGERGTVSVVVDGKPLGVLKDGANGFPLQLTEEKQLPANLPRIHLAAADEEAWFVAEHAKLYITLAGGKRYCVATWTPNDAVTSADGINSTILPLVWRPVEEVARPAMRFDRRDTSVGGQWKGKFGRQAVWIPKISNARPQHGYQLQTLGGSFTWQDPTDDPRALELPPEKGSRRLATCWNGSNDVSFAVTPPNQKPYRLTVYLLDFDHNGRAVEAQVSDEISPANVQTVSREETNRGVYLTWTINGKVKLAFRKTAGANVAVSGVFIDPADTNPAKTSTSSPR